MCLAFIADYYGDDVASNIQLDAEYYPSPVIYGDAHKNNATSNYIKKLR
ncbi:hypothetical protein [Pseudoalteromonas carrageenovora]|nr:hypothetical protein [Pseudoalteromonas carrageenovora]MDO6463553.1 hypothetical protein [Pseudoalteromonas carrageenovora]